MPRLHRGGDTVVYTHDATASTHAPSIVFLPGFRSHRTGDKATHLRALAKASGWAFTAIDYRGHGESSGDFERFGVADWADDAAGVLDALTCGPHILVGSSMGAWIAVCVALSQPDCIAAAVTVAAAPDFTEDLLWPSLSAQDQDALRNGHTVHRPSDYGDGPYPISASLIERSRHALVLRNPIPLRCPLRALHGEQDPDVPIRQSEALLQHWQGDDKHLIRIPDGDHRLSRPEDLTLLSDTVAEAVAAWSSQPRSI